MVTFLPPEAITRARDASITRAAQIYANAQVFFDLLVKTKRSFGIALFFPCECPGHTHLSDVLCPNQFSDNALTAKNEIVHVHCSLIPSIGVIRFIFGS